LFVTGEGSDAVVVVYPFQTEVAGTLLVGRAPGEMAATTTPSYLFVASPKSGDVSVLNLDTQRLVAAVSVGSEPCYIAITPGDELALVLNKTSGDMAVLRVGAIAAKRGKNTPPPLFTMIPVGSAPTCAVVRATS
jgi:YVTN family beta-propeller protein